MDSILYTKVELMITTKKSQFLTVFLLTEKKMKQKLIFLLIIIPRAVLCRRKVSFRFLLFSRLSISLRKISWNSFYALLRNFMTLPYEYVLITGTSGKIFNAFDIISIREDFVELFCREICFSCKHNSLKWHSRVFFNIKAPQQKVGLFTLFNIV